LTKEDGASRRTLQEKRLRDAEIHELDNAAVTSLSNVMTTRNLPLFGAPGVNKSLVEMYYPAC